MQTKARWMARAALFVLLFLALVTALQFAAAAREGTAMWWALVLPMPFYLFAMTSIWWALRLIGKGARLAPAISPTMRLAGASLFIGGLVEVFGPNLLLSQAGYETQPVNLTAMVIGVIGVGLYFLSSLIEDARAARAELDSFV